MRASSAIIECLPGTPITALLEQTAFLNWLSDRFEEGFYGIDLSGLCRGGDG